MTIATANPSDHGFDAERLGRIGAFLDAAYVEPGRLPHVQVLVARDGVPVYAHRSGVLRDDRTAMREDAIVRLASMTKPVTAIAFMQLVEQCRIALDDPVAKLFPEFAELTVYAGGGGSVPFVPGERARPMRFVDLMTHMAGFTYGLQNRTNVDALYREQRLDISRDAHDSGEFVAKLAKLPLEFQPGERWNYSVASDVLGVAVERLSGLPLGEYFQRHIFGPLGMADTGFDVPRDKGERMADAWQFAPGGKMKAVERGADSDYFDAARFHSGGGGLAGTLADYHRFCTMLLNRGALDGERIVGPKTIDLMTANHLPGGVDLTAVSQSMFSESTNAGVGFGLGFATVIGPARTLMPASLGEFYWGGAYSTAFFVDPVEGITCVFLTQLYPSNVYPVRRQLKTLIYAALEESRA